LTIIAINLNAFKMKSKVLLIAMLASVAMSTVACKKCQTCVETNAPDLEVCRDDFATVQQFDAVIITYENAGYTCN